MVRVPQPQVPARQPVGGRQQRQRVVDTRAGEPAPIAALLGDLLEPPVTRIGAMAFEEFLPPKDQQALAQDLNTLVASSKLKTWLSGAPLSMAEWLASEPDRSRLSIVSVAHLDDDERMLVLGLVLDEILAWVRGLSGTSELRALIVFDEVFGFLPPHPANPATKKPLLALLKQEAERTVTWVEDYLLILRLRFESRPNQLLPMPAQSLVESMLRRFAAHASPRASQRLNRSRMPMPEG